MKKKNKTKQNKKVFSTKCATTMQAHDMYCPLTQV